MGGGEEGPQTGDGSGDEGVVLFDLGEEEEGDGVEGGVGGGEGAGEVVEAEGFDGDDALAGLAGLVVGKGMGRRT